jgi:hypothetical protein
MLKQLGLLILFCVGCALILVYGSPVQSGKIPAGRWGGQHINIEVSANSAEIEYDCAHGTVQGPLEIDGNGRFRLRGTHTLERGGPVRRDESANTHPALYTGSIEGETMNLTVTLTDTNDEVGTYTLVKGKTGRLFKCV